MEMRRARPDDVEVVTAYYFAAWRSNLAHLFPEGALDDLPAADIAARRATFTSWFCGVGHDSVVIEDKGRSIGHATVHGDELVHLFIDPAHQGGGVGKALLREAERRIANDHRTARLMTLVGNDRAVEFYERHGWRLTGHTIEATYFGHHQVEQELVKSL